jgi:hypothetical protein
VMSVSVPAALSSLTVICFAWVRPVCAVIVKYSYL